MSKRIRVLTVADAAQLSSTAHRCWSGLDDGHPSLRAAQDQYGWCGVSADRHGRNLAHALVAPSFSLPQQHPLGSAPRVPDAAALVCLWVDDDYARIGWGRQLVQTLCAQLSGRVSCVLAASTGWPTPPLLDAAVRDRFPPDFLLALGFAPTEHPERYRLELSLTVPAEVPGWRRTVSRVASWVGTPRPEPASSRTVGTSPLSPKRVTL